MTGAVNLLANLDDPRFAQPAIHRALKALDARGIRPVREQRTPERILSWIDAEFGGTWSSEAAAGGIWIAEDGTGPLGFAAYDARGLGFHWLRRWQAEDDVGLFGPFGIVPRARGTGLGAVLLQAAMFSLRERGYRRALIPSVCGERLCAYYAANANARLVEPIDLSRGGRRWHATVLASGNGTNFQSVVDGARAGALPLDVRALIVNRPGAFALERAARAGIPAQLIKWDRNAQSREAYDARVLNAVAQTEPDLVLLLGWLHVLSPTFVERLPQILNLHPALLPLDTSRNSVTMPDSSVIPVYRGARAVDDALSAGSGWIGASVHRVGLAIDRGEVLARAPLRVEPGEPRAALDARLHALEHRVLAAAIRRWSFEQP